MDVLRAAWSHIKSQPFIAATGFAALVHSTWALGTLFSGAQPSSPELGADAATWITFFMQTFAWHAPALLIAFALDVGQVVTSHDITVAVKRGEKPTAKLITFAIFAIATYYLQWVYAAVHIPLLDLGSGVSAVHADTAKTLRDLAVWVVPALLPLSTLMYTFSHGSAGNASAKTHESKRRPAYRAVHIRRPIEAVQPRIEVQRPHAPALPAPAASAARNNPAGNYTGEAKDAVQRVGDAWIFTCPHCSRVADYASENSAVKGASAHIGRYCTKLKVKVDA